MWSIAWSFLSATTTAGAIELIYRAYFEEQLGLRFRSHGRRPMPHYPTYRRLLTAEGSDGTLGHFLSRPDDYAFVRELAESGRLLPVIGDFAGEHALRSIGRFVEEQGETVTAFYVSNVEFYLIRSGVFPTYVENVRALPARGLGPVHSSLLQLRVPSPRSYSWTSQHARSPENETLLGVVRRWRFSQLLGCEYLGLRTMSSPQWKRIRVDWQELLDAFEDGSAEHRYYLDRETGAVHFFSEYLDNEDEEEDERAITSEERYVQIPPARRTVSTDELREFIASLQMGASGGC